MLNEKTDYKNSEDSSSESTYHLTKGDKEVLLKISRNTLEEFISNQSIPTISEETLTENLKVKCGAFITLTKNKELRGCLGTFEESKKLFSVIQVMTIRAATKDPRFVPVSKDELKEVNIEISILTPMRKINSVDEIEIGKHGIYIIKGNRRGTLLPQVAVEYGWNKEQFLGYCALEKAGIGWNDWKDADIFIYEAIVFAEDSF